MNDKHRRPSMQDVADLVGTSKMTISRYLRAPELVAPATATRIAEVMALLGYIPSRVPEMLANDRSRAIGVLLPSMSNQVFAAVAQGIEEVTLPAGYHVLYGHYGYDAEREAEQIEQLLSFHIDGLILAESLHTERALKMLAVAAIPVVEIMDLPASPIDQAVGLDHTAAAAAMVSEILKRGKRQIVYLAARLDHRTRMREMGYRQAMGAAALPCHVIQTNASSTFSLGGDLFGEALTQVPDLDGIFCTNDDIAAGALLAAQAKGLRVPQDISIAGFNHLNIGLALQPQLASVITPRHAIGRSAAQRLMARISGDTFPNPIQDLGFELFIGSSI